MQDSATLRDVVLIIRDDESHHRDVNHGFADVIGGQLYDFGKVAKAPPHKALPGALPVDADHKQTA
jgi:ubiquinol oxidase